MDEVDTIILRVLARRERVRRGLQAVGVALALVAGLVMTSSCVAGSGQVSLNPQVGNWRGTEQATKVEASAACAEVDPPGSVVELLTCSGKEAEAIELLTAFCWEVTRAVARVRHARESCGLQ